jgi:hypothetical protein
MSSASPIGEEKGKHTKKTKTKKKKEEMKKDHSLVPSFLILIGLFTAENNVLLIFSDK